jgi:hypothetical protein
MFSHMKISLKIYLDSFCCGHFISEQVKVQYYCYFILYITNLTLKCFAGIYLCSDFLSLKCNQF